MKISLFFLIVALISCQQSDFEQGKRIYEANCANCHMSDGSGLNKVIPSLDERLSKLNVTEVYCVLKKGKVLDPEESLLNMPAFGKLSEVELCNLLNFMNEKWSNQDVLTISDIKKFNCK